MRYESGKWASYPLCTTVHILHVTCTDLCPYITSVSATHTHRVVQHGLVEALEHLLVVSEQRAVVDRHRDEVRLDGAHHLLRAEDLPAERRARRAAGNLLEEEEDGLSRALRRL